MSAPDAFAAALADAIAERVVEQLAEMIKPEPPALLSSDGLAKVPGEQAKREGHGRPT